MRAARLLGLAVGWGVGVLWAARAAAWVRGMSRLPDLREHPATPRGSVSVIVPARNEARAVEDCMRSLLASTGVDAEVIAVDDRSEDATGVILDWLTAQPCSERVRYVAEHVVELPHGWLGKPHAMARGTARAKGEWLLFTDADVAFAPGALARALAWAEAAEADHLLVVPTLVAHTAGERMMLPFLYALSIWGPRLWRVADPSARDAAGVGAFNLMRRRAYKAVGGWERLRMEVIEDLAMGVLLKRSGFRSRVATGPGLVRIRWAEGAGGVIRNLTKNVFAAFRFRIGLMAGVVVALAIMSFVPFAGVLIGLRRDRAWLLPSALSIGALTVLYRNQRHYADEKSAGSMLWLASFPAAAGTLIYAIAKSVVLTLRQGGVVWRGTLYPLEELRRNMLPLR